MQNQHLLIKLQHYQVVITINNIEYVAPSIDGVTYEYEIKSYNNVKGTLVVIAKIKTQAKEITKYLSKINTASYGILVLQSDSIYINLYTTFPEMYQEIMHTLNNVANFANNLQVTHKHFNIAMLRWYPSIETKHTNLKQRLEKSGKLKNIKNLE